MNAPAISPRRDRGHDTNLLFVRANPQRDHPGEYIAPPTGRTKDLLISGGRNAYSVEVGHALAAREAVAELALVARPTEAYGGAVAAVVDPVPDASVTPDGLRAQTMTTLLVRAAAAGTNALLKTRSTSGFPSCRHS